MILKGLSSETQQRLTNPSLNYKNELIAIWKLLLLH